MNASLTLCATLLRSARRTIPFVSILLVAGGLVLVGWALWAYLNPGPAPYAYRIIKEGKADQFPELGLAGRKDLMGLVVRQYELRSEDFDKPVAVAHVAGDKRGPVLLQWESRGPEPVLYLTPSTADTAALAEAVTKHVDAKALVLAWWDTSRQLTVLAGVPVLFDANLGEPVLVPTPWRARRSAIDALEHEFWRVPRQGETQALFESFVEALLADEKSGAAKLRELAGEREAYVIIHVVDAYKLGALRPERFGIGYKDFSTGGNFHALIAHAKDWLRGQGYDSYTVAAGSGSESARVYFFTDKGTAGTLAARMLPFSTSDPTKLAALHLVYQQGGYWVYRLLRAENREQEAVTAESSKARTTKP
jgi:hydroxylamine oxidation protein HaoB